MPSLGTPLTWLLAEILGSVVFIFCLLHAHRQKKSTIRILELLAYLLCVALYENGGEYAGIYDYSTARIMLFAKVPISIMLYEASILYCSMRLVDHLNVPIWSRPLLIGFFAMLQDVTIDPVAVHNTYELADGVSGRWNWSAHKYDNAFFGIPFYNFSGWILIMAYYTSFILLGRWAYEKSGHNGLIGSAYPFVAVVGVLILLYLPITYFLLWGMPFFKQFDRYAEFGFLLFYITASIGILLKYRGMRRPINLHLDKIILIVPVVLHLYDIGVALALQLRVAYIPVFAGTAVHVAFLYGVYRRSKAGELAPDAN